MDNCIIINNRRIDLTPEQVAQLLPEKHSLAELHLSDIPVGKTCKLGEHEIIVLEDFGSAVAVVRRDPLPDDFEFGKNNNYNGSEADEKCNAFAQELAAIVGEDNILLHTVDLTANDGLKDYGEITRKASAFTADRQRQYVDIMDQYKTDRWTWLATPWSTPSHESDRLVLCVSPSGSVNYYYYGGDYCGVRPFCILKSDIFVSK